MNLLRFSRLLHSQEAQQLDPVFAGEEAEAKLCLKREYWKFSRNDNSHTFSGETYYYMLPFEISQVVRTRAQGRAQPRREV